MKKNSIGSRCRRFGADRLYSTQCGGSCNDYRSNLKKENVMTNVRDLLPFGRSSVPVTRGGNQKGAPASCCVVK